MQQEAYNHKTIEKKWQKYWDEHQTFKTDVWDFSKPKYYVLDMFPYPSGVGLHAGHPEGYTATDIMSRMKRMQGYNVLHPMGYDSFGLPAEQYAVSTGHHPNGFTESNIETFSKQLKELGFDYDWTKMLATSDPKFYKWTQWIFKQLYLAGYAKLVDMPVNWCEELGTVLSNDEVIDGKSERGGYPVVRKNMKQWVIDQPAFAEKLLEGLNEIDWPESTKDMQRHWIGKSEGVAEFCDVFCEKGVFSAEESRRILLTGRQYGLLPKIHADEIEAIGGSELAGEIGAVSAEHLIVCPPSGIASMAEGGTVACCLPATSFYLGAAYAPVQDMVQAGVPVAMATDFNPGSCPCLNMQLVISLGCLRYRLTPEQALTAVTLNGAAAICRADRIGSIEPGKQADILIWNAEDLDYICYRLGSNLVDTVIKKGTDRKSVV